MGVVVPEGESFYPLSDPSVADVSPAGDSILGSGRELGGYPPALSHPDLVQRPSSQDTGKFAQKVQAVISSAPLNYSQRAPHGYSLGA